MASVNYFWILFDIDFPSHLFDTAIFEVRERNKLIMVDSVYSFIFLRWTGCIFWCISFHSAGHHRPGEELSNETSLHELNSACSRDCLQSSAVSISGRNNRVQSSSHPHTFVYIVVYSSDKIMCHFWSIIEHCESSSALSYTELPNEVLFIHCNDT